MNSLNSSTLTSTQNNGTKRADTNLQSIFSSSFDTNDLENNPK